MKVFVWNNNRGEILSCLGTRGKVCVLMPNGLRLIFNKSTLTPHIYTLEFIKHIKRIVKSLKIKTLADVGTGSGIIALYLAKEFPRLKIFASDISPEALSIAKQNAKRNNIENITFLQNKSGTWLSEFKTNIDVIVSNPPFIGKVEYSTLLQSNEYPELKIEPKTAVCTSCRQGTSPFIDIFKNSEQLKTKHILLFCNPININTLVQYYLGHGCLVKIYRDSENEDRFLYIKRPLLSIES